MIVNVSSGAATLGAAHEYVHYAAAKAGVDALTLGLAQEVAADGIRVNGVAPGLVRTDIHAAAGDPGRLDAGRRAGPAGPGRASPRRSPRRSPGCSGTSVPYATGATLRAVADERDAMRVLLALGGNAMTGPDGRARPEDQIAAAEVAMAAVADLVAHDVEVVITHGNGPQVGNLLVKNELAAAVVPPVPLDWCGAQTQATLGFVLMNALDAALAERGVDRRSATVVTRTLVDADDPGFAKPTKPIGRYLPRRGGRAARRARRDLGGPRREGLAPGRRLARAARDPRRRRRCCALVEAGFVVVANGGGGIPVVREATARCAASRRSSTRTSAPRCSARRSGPTCS